MDAIANVLIRAADDLAWFMRKRDIRLLHIVAGDGLRDPLLQVVCSSVRHPDNESPLVLIPDPFGPQDEWMTVAMLGLRRAHDARTRVMQQLGVVLPALPRPLGALGGAALLRAEFVTLLNAFAAARGPRMSGAIVALAPKTTASPEQLSEGLEFLLRVAALSDVRWILMDDERALLRGVPLKLGEAALTSICVPDPNALNQGLDQVVQNADGAPEGSSDLAFAGAAWPRVAPPPRKGKRVASDAEVLASLQKIGAAPMLVGSQAREFQRKLMHLEQSLRKQDHPSAIQYAREARDLALRAGLQEKGILFQIIIGSILLAAGQRPRAEEALRVATEAAGRASLFAMGAKALLSIGTIQVLERRGEEAIASYASAGEWAKRAGDTVLAIEGFRLAGQLCIAARLHTEGVKAWRAALEVADAAPAVEAASSSAKDVAIALANVCQKNGLHAQARSLLAQAERLAKGEAGSPQSEQASPPAAASPPRRVVQNELTDLEEYARTVIEQSTPAITPTPRSNVETFDAITDHFENLQVPAPTPALNMNRDAETEIFEIPPVPTIRQILEDEVATELFEHRSELARNDDLSINVRGAIDAAVNPGPWHPAQPLNVEEITEMFERVDRSSDVTAGGV